jgi:ubiquinone biosynthesis protein UbiJ
LDPLYQPIAALLNRGIRESESAQALCRELEGRSLAVRVEPPGIRLRIAIEADSASCGPDEDDAADVTLTTSLGGLNRILTGDSAAAIRAGDARLAGDAAIAENFQALLNFARPDPEEALSRLVGDVTAHQLGQAARGLALWARDAADSFSRSLTEYLQEERRDLPTRVEMQEFLDEVDRLANDVERATARVRRYKEAAGS